MSRFRLEKGTPPYLQKLVKLLRSNKPDYIFYALLFVLLTLAQFLHSQFDVRHDTFSTTAIVQIFGLALVLYAYWHGFLLKIQRWRWWHWLVIAWLIWGWLAVLTSSWLAPAISRQVEWMLVLMVVMATAGAIQSGRVTVTGIMLIVLLGLVVHAGNMLLTWFTVIEPRRIDWMTRFYPFTHIRHLGYLMAIYIVVSLYFSVYGQDSTLRRLAFVGFTIASALLFWSGSRGAFVAVLFTLTVGIIFIAARQRYMAFATIIIGSIVGYLLQLPFWVAHTGLGATTAIARSVNAEGTAVASGRIEIWERTLNYLVNHPWFGLGPDGYRFWSEKLSGTVQPHNSYIQSGLEWGIPGLLIFLIIIAFYWLNYLKQIRTSGVNASFAAFLIATVLLVHGLTDGTLYHIVSMMHFAVAFGVLVAYYETVSSIPAHRDIATDHGYAHKRPVISMVMAILIGVIGVNGYIVRCQDQAPAPKPDSWQSALIRAFPTSIRYSIDRWLLEWKTTYPAASAEWRDWLIYNSHRPQDYALDKALELKVQGNEEAAREILLDLLSKTYPFETSRRMQLEKLLEPVENKT